MSSTPSPSTELISVSIRPMQEDDLVEARRIFRVAFGAFLGVPDPEAFWADREYIFTRWRADPRAALVAEVNGAVAGSNLATNWGSFGFFGPLTVRPELWNQHIAQKLLGPTMDLLEKWGVREAGLFTFAHSPKHIALYQKFGFWPRFLTAIMSKSVNGHEAPSIKYSALNEGEQDHSLSACRKLTGSIYEGLDVSTEIRSVKDQNLGPAVGRRLARCLRSLPLRRGKRSRTKHLLYQVCRRPARGGRGESVRASTGRLRSACSRARLATNRSWRKP
jgi:RimJ/RimL family protein N-acetyltransferase